MKARKIHPFIAITLVACAIFFVAIMARITMRYAGFQTDAGFLATKQSIIHIELWRYSFYIHVLTSLVLIPIGLIQFLNHRFNRVLPQHKLLGKIYAYTILFASGPSGFVMALFANGGVWAKLSFLLLSLFWTLFTGLAFWYAANKKFLLHRNFMIRSFALTLSAITLRSLAWILPHFIHLNGKSEYVLIAWCSWIPNLLAAECLIWVLNKPIRNNTT